MAKSKSSSATVTVVAEPIWPRVSCKPYLVAEELEKDQIIIINDFLNREECVAFTKFLGKLALTATPPAKRGEANRVNDRISLTSESFAKSLFEAIQPHVSDWPSFQNHLTPPANPHSLNPNIRLYRYSEGQYFGPHYDDSVSYSAADGRNVWTEWTLLVYLTGVEDGVEGGETVFYKPAAKKKAAPPPVIAPLARGTALLHRHGKECMLHEGRKVLAGSKLVLRSDLAFAQS